MSSIKDTSSQNLESQPLLSHGATSTRPHRSAWWQSYKRTLVFGFVILSVVIGFTAWFPHSVDKGPVPFNGRLVTGATAAVAVEAEECSQVGVNILQQGGNAVDAAIASALCIGVIDSFATGIGGGGFMLIRSPNASYEFIDFRETAPAKAHRDMFTHDPKLAQVGGLSVAVPGEIRGFGLAHERHGKLPWATLFEPAIKLARNGFKTTPLLQKSVKLSEDWLLEKSEWTEVYAPNGHSVQVGDIVKRPALADTLEVIALHGPNSFYEGPIAAALVKSTQSAGGILTEEDLRAYQPKIRTPIETFYHGRRITTGPAPTSGPALLGILNLLERFNLRVAGRTGINVHRLVEAMKHGFAIRTELGDPDYTHLDTRYSEMISKEWAARVRQNISDDTTFDPLYYQPKFDHVETPGTMHLSVVDKDDGAVALTSTVNLHFGSHILDPVTGVILNDEMDDFSIPGKPNSFGLYPSEYNYIAPRKRPLSSITPTIVESDGRFEMALGGSGGSQIVSATLNVLINTLDYGMDIYQAIRTSRVHHQLLPNVAIYEKGFDPRAVRALEDRGHDTIELPIEYTVSCVQAVRRLPDGIAQGASDPRKYGLAVAY